MDVSWLPVQEERRQVVVGQQTNLGFCSTTGVHLNCIHHNISVATNDLVSIDAKNPPKNYDLKNSVSHGNSHAALGFSAQT